MRPLAGTRPSTAATATADMLEEKARAGPPSTWPTAVSSACQVGVASVRAYERMPSSMPGAAVVLAWKLDASTTGMLSGSLPARLGRPAHMTAVSGRRPAGVAGWSSGVMGFSCLPIVQYNALYEAVRFGGSCRGGQHHPGDRRPGPAGTGQPRLDPGPAGRALWRQPQN